MAGICIKQDNELFLSNICKTVPFWANVIVVVVVVVLCALPELEKAIISVMSVRLSAWNNSAPIGRVFIKIDTKVFFENLSRKVKFH